MDVKYSKAAQAEGSGQDSGSSKNGRCTRMKIATRTLGKSKTKSPKADRHDRRAEVAVRTTRVFQMRIKTSKRSFLKMINN
jgi:hypothetical protein